MINQYLATALLRFMLKN